MTNKVISGQPPDEQLMSSFQKGDQSGFRVLFLRYCDSLTRYATVLGQTPQEAQDIVQETFLKVYLNQARYDPQRPFKNWILTILRRRVIDELRRKKVPQISLDQDGVWENGIPDPDNPGITLETKVTPQDLPMLNGLKPLNREVVFLRIVEEFSYGEISQTTGLREDNIRQIVSRFLTKVRQEIEKHGLQSVSEMA